MYFKSCHFESHWRKCKEPDPELDPGMYPDPLVRGTDPRIRIRTICHGLAILRITYYEFCADPYPTFLGCDSGSILWIRLFTFCGSEKNESSFFDFDPNWNCSTVRFRKTDKLSNTIFVHSNSLPVLWSRASKSRSRNSYIRLRLLGGTLNSAPAPKNDVCVFSFSCLHARYIKG